MLVKKNTTELWTLWKASGCRQSRGRFQVSGNCW